ncbi:MAG: hypothetical protein NC904_08670, partial [Candidatus Omnitrophica bacterium]|nr:hypothetical protein [Candidatus Omnitrophota bacterium]
VGLYTIPLKYLRDNNGQDLGFWLWPGNWNRANDIEVYDEKNNQKLIGYIDPKDFKKYATLVSQRETKKDVSKTTAQPQQSIRQNSIGEVKKQISFSKEILSQDKDKLQPNLNKAKEDLGIIPQEVNKAKEDNKKSKEKYTSDTKDLEAKNKQQEAQLKQSQENLNQDLAEAKKAAEERLNHTREDYQKAVNESDTGALKTGSTLPNVSEAQNKNIIKPAEGSTPEIKPEIKEEPQQTTPSHPERKEETKDVVLQTQPSTVEQTIEKAEVGIPPSQEQESKENESISPYGTTVPAKIVSEKKDKIRIPGSIFYDGNSISGSVGVRGDNFGGYFGKDSWAERFGLEARNRYLRVYASATNNNNGEWTYGGGGSTRIGPLGASTNWRIGEDKVDSSSAFNINKGVSYASLYLSTEDGKINNSALSSGLRIGKVRGNTYWDLMNKQDFSANININKTRIAYYQNTDYKDRLLKGFQINIPFKINNLEITPHLLSKEQPINWYSGIEDKYKEALINSFILGGKVSFKEQIQTLTQIGINLREEEAAKLLRTAISVNTRYLSLGPQEGSLLIDVIYDSQKIWDLNIGSDIPLTKRLGMRLNYSWDDKDYQILNASLKALRVFNSQWDLATGIRYNPQSDTANIGGELNNGHIRFSGELGKHSSALGVIVNPNSDADIYLQFNKNSIVDSANNWEIRGGISSRNILNIGNSLRDLIRIFNKKKPSSNIYQGDSYNVSIDSYKMLNVLGRKQQEINERRDRDVNKPSDKSKSLLAPSAFPEIKFEQLLKDVEKAIKDYTIDNYYFRMYKSLTETNLEFLFSNINEVLKANSGIDLKDGISQGEKEKLKVLINRMFTPESIEIVKNWLRDSLKIDLDSSEEISYKDLHDNFHNYINDKFKINLKDGLSNSEAKLIRDLLDYAKVKEFVENKLEELTKKTLFSIIEAYKSAYDYTTSQKELDRAIVIIENFSPEARKILSDILNETCWLPPESFDLTRTPFSEGIKAAIKQYILFVKDIDDVDRDGKRGYWFWNDAETEKEPKSLNIEKLELFGKALEAIYKLKNSDIGGFVDRV